MRIAIVNDIHLGPSLKYKGSVRAASHLVGHHLQGLLHLITERHHPDCLINLGDLIRSESKKNDLKRYREMLLHFRGLPCPVIHLLGNHELKKMTLEDVEKTWQELGIDQPLYGLRQLGGFNLIWLSLEHSKNNSRLHCLPSDQLSWLKENLNSSRLPTLIFTHCAIDAHNVMGNFFYEEYDQKDPSKLFLENHDKIRDVISKSPSVRDIFQGHLHYFHTISHSGIPYITCPAFGDNICHAEDPSHVPEIYTIIDIQKDNLVAKAYSKNYSFAGAEFTTSE